MAPFDVRGNGMPSAEIVTPECAFRSRFIDGDPYFDFEIRMREP
jgi:hypothetical protein